VMATIALALFFLLLFAILGLNFFSGKFWSDRPRPPPPRPTNLSRSAVRRAARRAVRRHEVGAIAPARRAWARSHEGYINHRGRS
jgi:hypothetical protein